MKIMRTAACGLMLLAALRAANWTDRGEYDLVLTIRAEAAPQKRLALLDQWKSKYPQSELRQERRELYLQAYQSQGDSAKMLAMAEEMIGEKPDNFVGLYWCTVLIPAGRDSASDRLKIGETAAHQLLSGLDGYFRAGASPEKTRVGLLAHRALGWVAWQRGDYAAAEKEFAGVLHQSPKDGEITAWLGMVMALEKEPEKLVPSFWYLARAASMHDDGALPEGQRRQVDMLLEKLYVSYHGEPGGLEKLEVDAAASPDPPAGFTVESAQVIADRKAEEELERTNPELAAWKKLRKRLDAVDGDTYFAESVRNTPLPKLKGTLIRATPARRPKELVVWIGAPNTEEITLKLSAPFPNEADPGTALEFEGVPEAFTKSPFTMSIDVERDKVVGWPAHRGR
jgi:hypothetical protein